MKSFIRSFIVRQLCYKNLAGLTAFSWEWQNKNSGEGRAWTISCSAMIPNLQPSSWRLETITYMMSPSLNITGWFAEISHVTNLDVLSKKSRYRSFKKKKKQFPNRINNNLLFLIKQLYVFWTLLLVWEKRTKNFSTTVECTSLQIIHFFSYGPSGSTKICLHRICPSKLNLDLRTVKHDHRHPVAHQKYWSV